MLVTVSWNEALLFIKNIKGKQPSPFYGYHNLFHIHFFNTKVY